MKNSKVTNSVLQDWVMTLTWKEQTGLISAIRGVDMEDGGTSQYCKTITKMIRYLVLNNADAKTTFMTDEVSPIDEVVANLKLLHIHVSLGTLSYHWFDHIFLAIKIIMDKHPNAYTRMYWSTIYTKYNTPSVIKDSLEEVNISDDNIVEIKDILSLIDGNLLEIDNSGLIKEASNISYGGELDTDYIKPKPMVEIILDTKNEYPTIYDKSPVILDTTDCKDYGIYSLDAERFIDGKDVTYTYINILKTTQKQFKDMIEVLPQLDAILTGNWDVVNDNMVVDYNLSIPISKGVERRVKDSDTNRFMVANLTGELLYKDHLDVVWIIHSNLLDKDKLQISITRWIGDIDSVVYLLNPR